MLLEKTSRPPLWPTLVIWALIVSFGVLVYNYAPSAYQFYRKTQAIALEFTAFKQDKANHQKELEDTYAKGFADGVKSFSVPKVCTAWWFDTNSKERHEQARLAYCKGKK